MQGKPHTDFVIYDIEYTTWEGAMQRKWSGEHEHRELVQLSALRIKRETLEVLDSLDILVKPKLNPNLSDYFLELTGLSQDDVDKNGLDFKEAMVKFSDFAEGCVCCSYGHDMMMLAENMALYKEYGLIGSKKVYCMNFAHVFFQIDETTRQCNSGKLASHYGLEVPNHTQEHNALYDCYSLLVTLKHYFDIGKLTQLPF